MDASNPAGPGKLAPLDAALATERLRNARLVASMRTAAVALFFLLNAGGVVLGFVPATPEIAGALAAWAAYMVVALGLLVLARRARPGDRKASALAVPLLDVLAVFALQWAGLVMAEAAGISEQIGSGLVATTAALYAMFIVMAALSLAAGWVLATTALCALLLVLLGARAGGDPGMAIAGIAVLAFTAATARHLLTRLVGLMTDVVKEQVRLERFARYFSPQVAEALADLERASSPKRAEVTVLFCDLRGFTATTERLPAEEVVGILRAVHKVVVGAVFAHGGVLDKYLGDGVLAYFGEPLAPKDHAARAIRCAQAILEGMDALNTRRAAEGSPPLQVGLGLHTGEVVLGDVGVPERLEYTVIGDAVNVASRLEALTKQHGVAAFVSGITAELAGAHLGPGEEVRLRGRGEPVRVHALGATAAAAPGG